MNLRQAADAAIARARTASGLTAPEFDMQIARDGIGGIHAPIGSEVYTIATAHLPAVEAGRDNRLDERDNLHRELWQALQPELEAYAERCRTRKYTGWSTASKGLGDRVRYAD